MQALIGDTFDFNALIPMPKDLQGYSSPVDIISKEEYALQEIKYEKWVKTPKEERKPSYFIRSMTQEISDRFKQECGFDSWYEWTVQNWGTKWQPEACVDFGEAWVISDFLTAWSPPEPIYHKLCELFPNLDIKWHYNEPGCNFSGDFDTGEENDFSDPCDCGNCEECGYEDEGEEE